MIIPIINRLFLNLRTKLSDTMAEESDTMAEESDTMAEESDKIAG